MINKIAKPIKSFNWKILFCLGVFMLTQQPINVSALSDEQKKTYGKGIYYFDVASCSNVTTASASTSAEAGKDAQENAQIVYDFLTAQHGLTRNQAAGILANLYAESGINPKRVQGSGVIEAEEITVDGHTGYGIAQWTTRDRQKGLRSAADKANKSSSNLGVQMDYLWYELTHNYRTVLNNLKNTDDYTSVVDIILNQFEAPEDRNQVESRKTAFAGILANLKDNGSPTTASVASTSGSGGDCNCSPSAPTSTTAKTVAIDPGHGPSKTVVDNKTGLKQVESNNQPEGSDVWDVAQKVKQKLEDDGYNVVMVKKSEDESVTFRERAERADQANAAIAISIHGDKNLPDKGQIYPQKVGLYRGSGDNKTVFKDESVAELSQKYADTFKSQRQEAEGGDIVVKDNDFNGRAGLEPGNIQMVQLFSKTPWVYNEARMSFNKDKYAEGLVKGVEESIGSSKPANNSDSSQGCASGASAAGSGTINDIYSTAVKYVWPDYTKARSDPKPAYRTAYDKAISKGQYGGGGYTDCGAFVTRVMRDSGADPNYNDQKLPTGGQRDQLERDGRYERVNGVTNVGQLKPGDIAVNDKHTYMYVGKNAGLKPGYDSVSASLDSRTPMASNSYDLGTWSWFRLKSL